jgi:calcium-dependent protein kinase
VIPKNLIDQDEYLKEGLNRKINIMEKLKSPNIVAFLDFVPTKNNYYIVQELCDSGDFSQY